MNLVRRTELRLYLVPRSNHNILVPLQSNQPARTASHSQYRAHAPDTDPYDAVSDTWTKQNSSHTYASTDDKEDCQDNVETPGTMTEMSTEDWKEPEYFDREKRERKHVGSTWESRGKDRRSHESGIGRERSRKPEEISNHDLKWVSCYERLNREENVTYFTPTPPP